MWCQPPAAISLAQRIICQKELPLYPWMDTQRARLPGLSPVSPASWLLQDDAFAEQMAYRDELMAGKRSDVYQCRPEGKAGALELLGVLRDELPRTSPGYSRDGHILTRADGAGIDLAVDDPLICAGRLVQEDFALLKKNGDQHVFVGGLICFPAHWTLSEKMGRSLAGLHDPVDPYDGSMARRVERIFDNLRVEAPLERFNFLLYTNPDLYQPELEESPMTVTPGAARYVRVERQTLRRLPETQIVVFAIHTFLVTSDTIPKSAYNRLCELDSEISHSI